MDSVQKSAVVGRVATPLFNVFAVFLFAKYGLELDPETKQLGIDATGAILSAIPAVWGTFCTPLLSKLRQILQYKKEICSAPDPPDHKTKNVIP